MNIKEACKIALEKMPGYTIISASEIENGWLFSFGMEDGGAPDESPLFVSKNDGKVGAYNFEEHIMEILNATPISLSQLEFEK